MRLRRITLSGFKTFAARSEVIFDPGITAIVGPNGSGKSNLVDAVRWALGETNARELRGQRMDEVIYAGGGDRQRMGLAQVELVIDNEEGTLPSEDPEVSVSRRVSRGDRDTEFRINGDHARLRDLERLLGGTGLTQNGYAVVMQNDIDGIIEATPAQRRSLVEQAAGVRALRAACEEASHRLDGADVVVRRLTDLLEDATPRLAELSEQSVAAIELRAMSGRLTELRGSLAHEEWRAARASLKLARRRLEHALGRCEATAEADAAFAHRSDAARRRLEAARADRDAAARRLEDARIQVERGEGLQRRFADRLRSAVAQRGIAVADLRAIAPEVTAAGSALADVEAGDEQRTWDVLEREAARLRLAATEAGAEAEVEEERYAAAAAALAAAANERATAGAELRAAAARAELAASAVATLGIESETAAVRVGELGTALAARVAAANEAALRARETAAHVGAARGAVDTAWEAVNAADRAVAEAAGEARLALAALAEARGRLSGSATDGGIARAVAAGVLQARRLVDCIQITDETYAGAVAAALEENLGAWLVDDLAAAAAHLDREGPRERLLRADLDLAAEAPAPEPYVLISGAIEVAPAARGAVAHLLRDVWIAPTLESAADAFARGAAVAVLRDGTVVTPSGLRGGRAVETIELARAERAAAAVAEHAERVEASAVTAAANARDRLNDLDQALSVAVDADRAARAAEASAAALAAGAEQTLQAATVQAERAAATLVTRRGEAHAAIEAQTVAERRLAAAAERHAGLEADAAATERHTRQVRAAAETARVAAEEAELVLSRAKAEGAHLEERREAARRALDAARSRLAAAETRRLIAEGEALAAIVHGLHGRGEARRAALEQSTAQQDHDLVALPIAELELAVHALDTEHAEVAVAVARAADERAAAELEVAACESAVAEHADAVRDLTDDDSAELDPAAAERAEREIVRLERRIAALGAVNALAPEQHAALDARVIRIAADRDDIARAGNSLRVMARRLEREIEQRFDTVFGAVSFHFQELYAELFPGGRATLRLEEPEPATLDLDGTETAAAERRPGVEILAQPPGKRPTPLRLLSGGERALTALAVVLALQQVNPSPFYVFDEVDAALDDSNVLRFTRLLRRLGAEQQFLVVTHNHITMAAADALWGVTIDADGTSSVLGVRFDEAEATGAPTAALHRVAG
ncbi:MAG: chromosome segregation protein SMC [Candidatus Dormibacteria bacterium]